MPAIISRWEWRVFGESLSLAGAILDGAGSPRVSESEDLYVVSAQGRGNVKIRDGRLEIKELQAVNDSRLEQWLPVLKARFPLGPDEFTRVWSALDPRGRVKSPPDCDLDRFLDDLIEPHPELHTVKVLKKRSSYLIKDALAEIAELTIAGKVTRTICVEDVDPDRVIALVRSLKLDGFRNTNYVSVLRRAIGLEPNPT